MVMPSEIKPLLKAVDTFVFDDEKCSEILDPHFRVPYNKTFELCAWAKGRAHCSGDSGGPFMCEQNGQFVLHGVVSRSVKPCAVGNYPTVYAKVLSQMDFIKESIGQFISEHIMPDTKAELPLEGIFFPLNFLPWEFLLVKKLEIEKTKTTFIIYQL